MAPSSSTRFASRRPDLPLPSTYTYIDAILEGKVPVGKPVDVVGLVKDYRVPIPTNGSDYKCTITIYDKSIEFDGQTGITLSIFRQLQDMPEPTAGDVLVIKSAKVQSYRESISLLTSKTTSIHIYSGSEIPKPPSSAARALQPSSSNRQLGEKEHGYVSWLYHHIDKHCVPDEAEYQCRVDRSRHTKEKFCTLQNAANGTFCDIIVNVVKAPFDEVGKTTLWVSDYTENDSFHKFSWDGARQLGDPTSVVDTDRHVANKWAGPFGKRSMQITCFEPHASLVNSEVEMDQWIRLRNLHIKLGNNGLNLEGVLHEDNEFNNRRQLDILRTDDRKGCEPRLKDAIRRKADYEKLKKQQMKSFTNESGVVAGAKRKAEKSDEPKIKMNSKMRRHEEREKARKNKEEYDKRAEERLGLNDLVKCESQEQPLTPLPSVLETVPWKTTLDGTEVTLILPFVCANYRTNVRVVDFRPRQLEDFATWRKSTEFDVLSDYDGESSSELLDDDEDEDGLSLAQQSGEAIWEWRFALQLENGDPQSKEKERLWAVVDNNAAQMLTGMDANDLRQDPDALSDLREQLFKLWGNLEEVKRQEQQRELTSRRRLAANQPPPSSPMSGNIENLRQGLSGAINKNHSGIEVSNKPFACCIRQYGVRVREPDPRLTNAEEGHRWMRVFGLFGTKISK
ncbi:hypothetical protein F4808DRAFT_283311 [Astrocystis sublimbata]|nr:hypothetical protein F4808DRAFT_283311 [Astrocystis sublimbata]